MSTQLEWAEGTESGSLAKPPEQRSELDEAIGLRGLWWLFFQPTRFFSNDRILNVRPHLPLVIYFYLVARSIDRIDRQLTMSEFGGSASTLQSLEKIAPLDSWPGFWIVVLFLGPIGAIFVWWIAMWWYEVRLRWAGAKEQNIKHVRAVFGYSSLVLALPTILLTLYDTVAFANYRQAYNSDETWWWLFIVIFALWAIVVSYKGVRAVFPVSIGKARFWFLILPGSIFFIVIAFLIFVFAMEIISPTVPQGTQL